MPCPMLARVLFPILDFFGTFHLLYCAIKHKRNATFQRKH